MSIVFSSDQIKIITNTISFLENSVKTKVLIILINFLNTNNNPSLPNILIYNIENIVSVVSGLHFTSNPHYTDLREAIRQLKQHNLWIKKRRFQQLEIFWNVLWNRTEIVNIPIYPNLENSKGGQYTELLPVFESEYWKKWRQDNEENIKKRKAHKEILIDLDPIHLIRHILTNSGLVPSICSNPTFQITNRYNLQNF